MIHNDVEHAHAAKQSEKGKGVDEKSGPQDRIESVEGTDDLEEVAETSEQKLIDTAQSNKKKEDKIPSTEGNGDEQRMLPEHICIDDVEEVHKSVVPEKVENHEEVSEEDINNEKELDVLNNTDGVHKTRVSKKSDKQVDVHEEDGHNKEMEVMEDRSMGGC
ncbi:hypothetical protein K7X08_032432 [Anisodus acutangulus]|uniref:Uncharacterized protein n=1 Tax=Anisodus acutangulus TaxID=402998 RepID=A0A9Q1RS68_9SOLA|nr:hypothetical protein K7X08_032432 [Anisodus acutangulus]